MQKYVVFCCCMLLSVIAQSAIAYTCTSDTKNFTFSNNHLILTGTPADSQRYYLLTNISQQVVGVDIAIHTGASAGWGSQIHPGKHSVIAMNRSPFTLSCSDVGNNNQLQPLNCQQVLSVCQLAADASLAGSFWVKEDVN